MLRTAMVVLLCLAAVSTAAANPVAAELYVDFYPPNMVFTYEPTPYESFYAYVVLEPYGAWVPTSSVSFDVSLDPDIGILATEFQSTLPGASVVGAPGEGITVSSGECLGEPPLVLGQVGIFYLGGSGYVRLAEHPDLGNVYSDCEDPVQEYEYCYVQDGGIYAYDVWPRNVCVNPVTATDWGVIKAMYR